jgi:hypothetical protein
VLIKKNDVAGSNRPVGVFKDDSRSIVKRPRTTVGKVALQLFYLGPNLVLPAESHK